MSGCPQASCSPASRARIGPAAEWSGRRRNGVGIEKLPATTDLFELYLPEEGGYPLFSTLFRAASHPGAFRPFMFYANPAKGVAVDYDFQGMHAMRAYWLSRSLLLHIALCRLVAPSWAGRKAGRLSSTTGPAPGTAGGRG